MIGHVASSTEKRATGLSLSYHMTIEKKVWPPYFQKILNGDKTFEVRLADFECAPDDTLVLREWDPTTGDYTGRAIEKRVTYVAKTKNFTFFTPEEIEKFGYQIIGFK